MKLIAMTVFCVDFYKGPDSDITCVGGNSLNFAVQSVKSGVEQVSVMGAVGEDANGRLVKKYLERRRISTSHIKTMQGRTASNKIFIKEDGDRYFLPDSWDNGVFADFRPSHEDWNFIRQHDVIAMAATDPNLFDAIDNKAANNRMVIDLLDNRDYGFITHVLDSADIGFISGDDGVIEALRPYAREHRKPIVVTLGERGSMALFGQQQIIEPAAKVNGVVDTTGCGDAYQAAFTASYFRDGDIHKAMREGAAASVPVLAHFGGVEMEPEDRL